MNLMNRDELPSDAENFDVYCERCKKVHRYYTFTREDYDRMIEDAVHKLTEAMKIYGKR